MITLTTLSASDTRPLRQQLLRQGVPLDQLVYDGDDDADALHLGALDGEALVGIASVVRQSPAVSNGTPAHHPNPHSPHAWRIRGMAVLPDYRAQGVGKLLLLRCIDYAFEMQGRFIWCDARIRARGFYEKYGLRVMGEVYDVPNVGQHYYMQRDLARVCE